MLRLLPVRTPARSGARRALQFRSLAPSALLLLALAGTASPAAAGSFDVKGEYRFDSFAVATLDFATDVVRFVPTDAEAKCKVANFKHLSGDSSALAGTDLLRLDVPDGCAERFIVHLPAEKASYRASLWMRHGGIDARFVITHTPASKLDTASAELMPTGRTTSDGWVELACNDLPVDGASVQDAYLRVESFAGQNGVDIDAFEVVPSGVFTPPKSCIGVGDAACDSSEEVCMQGHCVLARLTVPPLPSDAIKNEVVDVLASKLRVFYGGRRSRQLYLPDALESFEEMRSAKTAWQFWGAYGKGINRLHDWHTGPRGGPSPVTGPRGRLNACFFEGDADLSHSVWPKDPKYADVLVSHVGPGANGLQPGDRLVAVDGHHPFEWVDSLADVDWGRHVATDPDIYADHAEALGGPSWSGKSLIVKFATTFTVIRCNPAAGTCSSVPETIAVKDLGTTGGGADVACDNRPFYHFDKGNPDPAKHYVFGDFFRGRIADSTPEEAIYGMVWDTLYGGGDPNSSVNMQIANAIADWKASAHGVILDHRAGNGGTLDTPTLLTTLVRPPGVAGITRMPIELSGFDGPNDDAAGLSLFNQFKDTLPFNIGDPGYDAALPVALILHRDGSASDFFPLAMKGAPNVRIFGPHPTVGAFSTYIEYPWWGGFGAQVGSGDLIEPSGQARIGHGLAPDEVVLPLQSDLLAGKDTLFEAALAWVKKGLKKP